MKVFKQILSIAQRECGILMHNPIYLFCMVVFPIIVMVFFTSLMKEGQPENMPVGVVDLDNTTTTRALIRKLDAFQTTRIVGHYTNMNEAREAIQRNEIYAFIYFPKHTTDELLANRQPKISFYYSDASITSGSLLFRDLKTISTLGSAAVGSAKLSALGKTPDEIKTFLQPISIDLHPLNNPEINYNVYLTCALCPAILMLFVFLITAYSIGTELKFNRSKEWMKMADNNVVVALVGKMLPQFLVLLTIFYFYQFYIYQIEGFPHYGGVGTVLLLGLLAVTAGEGFGIFAFGLMPSLRMSMSICSLWAALSFSIMGSAFPITAMDPEIEAIAQLFPMRHYFMVYQICVFNGYPLMDAWVNIAALIIFTFLPLLVLHRIRKAMLEYIYIP
ncbi:MAG: ABC transporter permease [Prevotella sp.]|nr:ABC transporter permease [Prevotella sp.]MCI2080970.1 ABC transporter permease [Prevotella sp.]MCI2102859.1 ABC transporter permease [Prevotella sp.]